MLPGPFDRGPGTIALQAAFGLRRGESIKIRPGWADRGDELVLKDSWTKGGRAREIPIAPMSNARCSPGASDQNRLAYCAGVSI